MSEYKLIAFDMDGTLLDSNKRIRQDSLDAIAEAVKAGKYVALSTGRSTPEIKEYLKELKDVRYIMSSSGAYLYTNPDNQAIFDRPFEYDTVKALFKATSSFDLMWHLHGHNGYVQKNQASHLEDYGMSIYRNLFQTLDKYVDDLQAYYEKHRDSVYKFNCYCRTPEQREIVREAVEKLPVTIAYSEKKSIEISPEGISKASGLQKLCEYLGIETAQSIVVGDGDNDLEILKVAGLAVAMGNSNKSVLDIADVVVKDNNNGGCAQAVRDYLL